MPVFITLLLIDDGASLGEPAAAGPLIGVNAAARVAGQYVVMVRSPRTPMLSSPMTATDWIDLTPQTAMEGTRRRWQIRMEQIRSGAEPCFASDRRQCEVETCPWYAECQQLRAEWRR